MKTFLQFTLIQMVLNSILLLRRVLATLVTSGYHLTRLALQLILIGLFR